MLSFLLNGLFVYTTLIRRGSKVILSNMILVPQLWIIYCLHFFLFVTTPMIGLTMPWMMYAFHLNMKFPLIFSYYSISRIRKGGLNVSFSLLHCPLFFSLATLFFLPFSWCYWQFTVVMSCVLILTDCNLLFRILAPWYRVCIHHIDLLFTFYPLLFRVLVTRVPGDFPFWWSVSTARFAFLDDYMPRVMIFVRGGHGSCLNIIMLHLTI